MVPVGWGASDSSALSGRNGGVCPPPSTYLGTGTVGAELADGTGTARAVSPPRVAALAILAGGGENSENVHTLSSECSRDSAAEHRTLDTASLAFQTSPLNPSRGRWLSNIIGANA